MGANISTVAWKDPSRKTRATPFCGPRRPTHRTSVPVKVNVACAPGVAETWAVPPLQARGAWASAVQPALKAAPVSSTRVPVVGRGEAGSTSNASTTTA